MTEVSQPLDNGPFSAVESATKSLTHRWYGQTEKVGKKLGQYDMMKIIVYHAVEQVFSKKETVISSFRRTGIFPWRKIDPKQLEKLTPGTVYVHSEVFPDPSSNSDPVPELWRLL